MARDLTADERAALARYIAQHGRTWKRDLRRMWIDSNPHTEDETYLYTLRNSASFGPRWLARYKPDLNAVGAAARAHLDLPKMADECCQCYPADRIEPCAKCNRPIAIGEPVHSYCGVGPVVTKHHACDGAQPALPGAD